MPYRFFSALVASCILVLGIAGNCGAQTFPASLSSPISKVWYTPEAADLALFVKLNKQATPADSTCAWRADNKGDFKLIPSASDGQGHSVQFVLLPTATAIDQPTFLAYIGTSSGQLDPNWTTLNLQLEYECMAGASNPNQVSLPVFTVLRHAMPITATAITFDSLVTWNGSGSGDVTVGLKSNANVYAEIDMHDPDSRDDVVAKTQLFIQAGIPNATPATLKVLPGRSLTAKSYSFSAQPVDKSIPYQPSSISSVLQITRQYVLQGKPNNLTVGSDYYEFSVNTTCPGTLSVIFDTPPKAGTATDYPEVGNSDGSSPSHIFKIPFSGVPAGAYQFGFGKGSSNACGAFDDQKTRYNVLNQTAVVSELDFAMTSTAIDLTFTLSKQVATNLNISNTVYTYPSQSVQGKPLQYTVSLLLADIKQLIQKANATATAPLTETLTLVTSSDQNTLTALRVNFVPTTDVSAGLQTVATRLANNSVSTQQAQSDVAKLLNLSTSPSDTQIASQIVDQLHGRGSTSRIAALVKVAGTAIAAYFGVPIKL